MVVKDSFCGGFFFLCLTPFFFIYLSQGKLGFSPREKLA